MSALSSDRAPFSTLGHKRVIDSARTNPGDLLQQMGTEMYQAAYDRGISLSALLEMEAPSTLEDRKQGLDTFNRILKYAEIRTASVPEIGVYASPFDDMFKKSNLRALVPEFMIRTWRRAQMGQFISQRAYGVDDYVPGSLLNAWSDVGAIRQERRLAPAIPLAGLIAQTTPVRGNAARTFYMTDDASQERMVRVEELAEVQRAQIKGGEHQIRLRKYGRAIEASYETLRSMPIDRVAWHLARLSIQSEIDKVAAVIDVIVNGDGNVNTGAQSYNLTALDPTTTAGNMTLTAYLAWKMKFANPYMLTSILTREDAALKLMLLNVGSANIPLVSLQGQLGIGSFTPINQGLSEGTGLGWTADAPANVLVGFDSRTAVERFVEIGASLRETDRFITRQSEIMVVTEVEGYGIMDGGSARLLNLAA